MSAGGKFVVLAEMHRLGARPHRLIDAPPCAPGDEEAIDHLVVDELGYVRDSRGPTATKGAA